MATAGNGRARCKSGGAGEKHGKRAFCPSSTLFLSDQLLIISGTSFFFVSLDDCLHLFQLNRFSSLAVETL